MMNSTLRSIFLVAPLALAACAPQILGGGGGTGGTGGEGICCIVASSSTGGPVDTATSGAVDTTTGGPVGSTSTGGFGGSAPTEPALAMTRAQFDVLWDAYWASQGSGASGSAVTSGGGPSLDPNDLFVRISDLGVACDSPTTTLSCGGHWSLTLVLPPAIQQVGTYDLESQALLQYSSMTETGPANSPTPEDCSWGGGSLGAGQVEVLSIDATSVHFRLTMPSTIWDSDPSGEYTALRCP